MNIFHIPSWYMSSNDPLVGSFFKDQALAVANIFPSCNVGISTWGQNDKDFLIAVEDHIYNVKKIVNGFRKSEAEKFLLPNAVEYFNPSFTFTRKFLKGNIINILNANIINLQKFEARFGKVDVVHAHCAYPGGYIAMLLKKKLDIPYVITEQMSPFPFKSFLTRKGDIDKFIKDPYLNADALVAVSPALAKTIEQFSLGKPKVIFNPVDGDTFTPVIKEPAGNFRFFTLARLEHQKGIDILLKSIQKVSSITSNVHFVIGGDGSQAEALKKLAVSLGLSDHIEWLGALLREQAVKQFQLCDAFVLSSRHESQGIVFTEAMACGKPCIGTICGGPEFLINDKNGMLVPTDDVSALSDAAINMIHKKNTYQSDKIREDFLRRFSVQAFAPQMMDVYNELIGQSSN